MTPWVTLAWVNSGIHLLFQLGRYSLKPKCIHSRASLSVCLSVCLIYLSRDQHAWQQILT